jgi:hypothetical protein
VFIKQVSNKFSFNFLSFFKMSSTEEIIDIIALMKGNHIYGKEPGKWVAVTIAEAKPRQFVDHAAINDFYGVVFRYNEEDGSSSDHFNPPAELNLEHDDIYGKNKGFWKKFVAKEIKAVRTLVETGISAPVTSSSLRSWDSKKISKYLLGEAENYEALYACIVAQLENVPTNEARNAIEQLTALMETTTEPVQKTQKSLQIDDDEDELVKKMQAVNIKKPSPKKRSPSPKRSSPEGKPNTTEQQLTEQYERLSSEKDEAESKLSKTNSEGLRKILTKKIENLNDKLSKLESDMEKLGFGRSRLKPYRRKSRRMSNKKMKLLTRRTSKVKAIIKVRKSRRSLKKNKRRTSKSKKLKKSFGSTIYGLQGGMQSGPIYDGVYPMTLKVNETLPNLNNVKRSYTLNEFGRKKNKRISLGKKRAKTSLIRKQSKKIERPDRRGRRGSAKIATVIDSESDESDNSDDSENDGGSSFGCSGCSSCGRSFGTCKCNDDEE